MVEYTSRFLLVASFDKSKVKQKFETTKFFFKYFFYSVDNYVDNFCKKTLLFFWWFEK